MNRALAALIIVIGVCVTTLALVLFTLHKRLPLISHHHHPVATPTVVPTVKFSVAPPKITVTPPPPTVVEVTHLPHSHPAEPTPTRTVTRTVPPSPSHRPTKPPSPTPTPSRSPTPGPLCRLLPLHACQGVP